MNLTEIIKNQEFFKKIAEKKEKNMLSNANLFFCEDNLTSDKVLILVALMLEYDKTFELFDCQSAEFLKIENGADLDVKVYPKNKEKLLVSDSNEIVSEAYIKPVNLLYKIFIINSFDSSTEEAQNKLLKVLEEPPKNVYFLLSAKSEERVLPTIKSRCDKIVIPPLSEEELNKLKVDSIAKTLGGGQIGKTLQLDRNTDLNSVAEFAVSLFTELKNSKQVLKFSRSFIDKKEYLDLILEVMSLCIEDIIKLKCESENLCKLDMFKDKLQDVELEFSVEALCEISKLIAKLKEKIEFNANLTIAIDNFLLKMLEVKFLCK